VVSENDEVQEQLSILAAKGSGIELLKAGSRGFFHPEALLRDPPDLLLIKVSGNLDEDISLIRKIRNDATSVHIVMYGCTGDEPEFLQYVRAGIRGYLQAGASAEDVLEGLLTVFAGRAFCPDSLCGVLFR
jgi:DNA-binding NarL/FixJ family response regulator